MKIWYDVSGLYQWNGNLTGIQRVVYHLGKELHDANPDAHFFVFRHGAFEEINFQLVEERVRAERNQSHIVASAATTGKLINVGALRHYGIIALKSGINGTRLDPPLRSMYAHARSTYRGVRSRSVRSSASGLFAAGDTVVIVDGNWQFAGFAEALKVAKERHHFQLVHFAHDLTAVRNPALVNKGAEQIIGGYFEKILPIADVTIAISQSTKRDIAWYASRLGVPAPHLKALILADSSIREGSERATKKPAVSLPEQFILAVGTIEIRKNYTALYYAYKLALQQGVKLPHLVVAGKKGWMAEEAYALLTQDTELQDHISVLLGPSDQELAWLYENCQFTVFPSFYEGWGLPVAESFAYGKVCISSNTSSMPEVGGNLAVYISPYDPHDIMKKITMLSADTAQVKSLEAAIHAKYKPRSWRDSYDDFLKLL